MSQELPWGLFPAPRHVELVGEGLRSYDPEVSYCTAPELPAEGYDLSIGPRGVEIRHADAAGIRYANGALAQLREYSQKPENWSQEESEFTALRLQLKQEQRQLTEDAQELRRREKELELKFEEMQRPLVQEKQRQTDFPSS